ncbi:MAG TPA: twin-arginine translocation pathway signal protein, partial [Rhodobacteraceae bacterium]|nr:twin-arginine translocation pathway signal protein [Paracoccaceae bacterium]
GTAAPAALVAVTAGTDTAEAAAPQPTNGLQDNAHTRTYYQLARF